MVRVLNSDTPLVDWSQEFYDFSTTEANDFYRLKEPQFMINDATDNKSFFLVGRYQGRGSVQKFTKKNGRLLFWMRFDQMTNIRSFI